MALTWETIDTDILVVGGGAAGCLAAIEAARRGARVVLASKMGLGAGCSIMARGGFQAAVHPEDSPELHYQDTLEAGCGLNNRGLVRLMCHEVVEVVHQLDCWGVDFVKRDGIFDQKWVVGSSRPRHIHHFDTTGRPLMHTLKEQVHRQPITVLANTTMCDLLLEDGTVVGAWGLLTSQGKLLLVSARAVVLATGGGSQLFAITDNPPYMTGDGHGMAYRAGAQFVDMEMVEFQLGVLSPRPLAGYPPNSSAWIARGARLYNGLGERFMHRYDPARMEKASRAAINAACGTEIYHGRGTPAGGIYLDCSDLPPELIQEVGPEILAAFQRAGVDLRYQPMELGPGSHDFLGGLRIDKLTRTTVEGLFAAGEVAGGVQGANRLGGNALAAAIAFGARAGRCAADYASKRVPGSTSPKCQAEAESRIAKLEGDGLDAMALRHKIQHLMTRYVGLVRDGAGLRQTVGELATIEEKELPNLRVAPGTRGFQGLRQLFETVNLVQVAWVVATAALARAESRGVHYRLDHPETDDDRWLRNIVIARGPDGPTWHTTPVVE